QFHLRSRCRVGTVHRGSVNHAAPARVFRPNCLDTTNAASVHDELVLTGGEHHRSPVGSYGQIEGSAHSSCFRDRGKQANCAHYEQHNTHGEHLAIRLHCHSPVELERHHGASRKRLQLSGLTTGSGWSKRPTYGLRSNSGVRLPSTRAIGKTGSVCQRTGGKSN